MTPYDFAAGLDATWVGGDEVGTGNWRWDPSDVLIPLPPNGKWEPGVEPNGNGDCLAYTEGFWNDRGCDNTYPSVCVIDLASTGH